MDSIDLIWIEWFETELHITTFTGGWVADWMACLKLETWLSQAQLKLKLSWVKVEAALGKKGKNFEKTNCKQRGQKDAICNGFIFNFHHFDNNSPPMFPIDNFTSCLFSEGLTMQTLDLYPLVSDSIACSNLCFQVIQ